MTDISFGTELTNVNWTEVTQLLHSYGLTDLSEDKIKLAFENSYRFVFVFDAEGQTVGVARAVSDGVTHAEIYNIALAEKYHHLGIGRQLFQRLVDQLDGMIVTLYTHPKTIEWYKSLGMSQLNTAMVLFRPHEKEWMLQEKFIDD